MSKPARKPLLNAIDRVLMTIDPQRAERRVRARYNATMMASAYEAVDPGRLRKRQRDYGSGNSAVAGSGERLRVHARNLDRNHDIAQNALNVLVQNVIGPNGITIEPQPLDANGEIHQEFANALAEAFKDWGLKPEVTWQHDWPSSQRLMGRTWFRDGESFAQELFGAVPGLDHGTKVQYSLELIEPDLLPIGFSDPGKKILQSVERNDWGRPVAYHICKQHPGDIFTSFLPETKRISADRIRHLKLVDRIGQVRGVSIFASVLTRFEDLKDYEESERIAAKIAASMAAVIIKGDPQSYNNDAGPDGTVSTADRNMTFQAGMIFDDLRPGESVQTIDSKRPNANLEPYRNGQLRAAAGGLRVSFSSLSRNYTGTYSAQRQELVEGYGAYGVLANEFIGQLVRPVYNSFVRMAIASGAVKVPAGVRMESIYDALYTAPQMPWIDPLKEAAGFEVLDEKNLISPQEIIRRRGGVPSDVLKQRSAWQKLLEKFNLLPAENSTTNSDSQDNANARTSAIRGGLFKGLSDE